MLEPSLRYFSIDQIGSLAVDALGIDVLEGEQPGQRDLVRATMYDLNSAASTVMVPVATVILDGLAMIDHA